MAGDGTGKIPETHTVEIRIKSHSPENNTAHVTQPESAGSMAARGPVYYVRIDCWGMSHRCASLQNKVERCSTTPLSHTHSHTLTDGTQREVCGGRGGSEIVEENRRNNTHKPQTIARKNN